MDGSVSRIGSAIVLAAFALAACNADQTQGWTDGGGSNGGGGSSGGGSPTIFTYSFDDSAFQASYANLQDFSGFESVAENIRNSASFALQNFVSVTMQTQHFSFDTANVEYAHAVGLTGDGQTIAVVDEGFQIDGSISLFNDELLNKNITSYGDLYQPSPSDPCLTSGATCTGAHGTAVAAIAASDGGSGRMTGVAPGADLILVSYYDEADVTAATIGAANAGAIVQNNSWGYDGYPATQAEFNNLRASSADYLDALTTFAQNGVLVFGASNNQFETNYDLSAALPDFIPALEESFLLVGNATPYFGAGGDIVGAQRVSAACLEAARYCLVADGTVYAPDIRPGQPYVTNNVAEWTGTSFAAPQVSGAIALLAEAFPTLSAQELRARLLASADNSFFSHDGYVQFSQNVRHGFNSEYGHGFLDVAAALLPIGGRYVATAAGAPVSVEAATIVSRGGSGAAVSRALQGESFLYQDGLGTDFNNDATLLATHAQAATDAAQFARSLTQWAQDGNSPLTGFAPYLQGLDLDFASASGTVSLFAPAPGSGRNHMGLDVWTSVDQANSLGFGLLFEDGSVMGLSNGFSGAGEQALQASLGYQSRSQLAPGISAGLGLRLGVAQQISEATGLASFGPTSFAEAGATLAFADVAMFGDQLTLRAAMPQTILDGQAQVSLPVARSQSGAIQMRELDVGLRPEAAALDLSFDYSRPLGQSSEVTFSGEWGLNAGHQSGAYDATIGFGWRMRF